MTLGAIYFGHRLTLDPNLVVIIGEDGELMGSDGEINLGADVGWAGSWQRLSSSATQEGTS